MMSQIKHIFNTTYTVYSTIYVFAISTKPESGEGLLTIPFTVKTSFVPHYV